MHISSLLSYILCVMHASSVLCMRAYLHVPPYMRVRMRPYMRVRMRMRTRVRTCVRMPMRLPMDVAMRVLVAMRVHVHVWDVSCACMGCLMCMYGMSHRVVKCVCICVSPCTLHADAHTRLHTHAHTYANTANLCTGTAGMG